MLIIKVDLWKSGRWFVDFCKFQDHFAFWRPRGMGKIHPVWLSTLRKGRQGTGRLSAVVQALFLEEVFLSGWYRGEIIRVRVLVSGDEKF